MSRQINTRELGGAHMAGRRGLPPSPLRGRVREGRRRLSPQRSDARGEAPHWGPPIASRTPPGKSPPTPPHAPSLLGLDTDTL
eukprot:1194784-Prorocentrum_minimum.AAC.3